MKITIDDQNIRNGIAAIAKESGVPNEAAAVSLLQFALVHMRRRAEDRPTITAPRVVVVNGKTVRVIDRPGAPPLIAWRDVLRAMGIERNGQWFAKRYAVPVVSLPADLNLPPQERGGRPIALVLSLPDLARFANELDASRYFAEVAAARAVVDGVVNTKAAPVRYIGTPASAAGWYWIDVDGKAHGPLPSEDLAAKARVLGLAAAQRKAEAAGIAEPPAPPAPPPPAEAFYAVKRYRLETPIEGSDPVIESAGRFYHRTANPLEVVGPYVDREVAARAFTVYVEPTRTA